MMREIKGITIHNTGNYLSAEDCYNYLKLNGRLNLCHYLIDEKKVIATTPEYLMAFHTGKGYDKGNMNTIAVEICRSTAPKNLYLKAQKNAVKFIKGIMAKYNLTANDIYFHNDFNPACGCPHRILQEYKTKRNFIKEMFK